MVVQRAHVEETLQPPPGGRAAAPEKEEKDAAHPKGNPIFIGEAHASFLDPSGKIPGKISDHPILGYTLTLRPCVDLSNLSLL